MRTYLLVFSFLIFNGYLFAQIGIGVSVPDNSAALDITSTNKGFLPPRLASDADVDNPAVGLIIYDESDDCLNLFNGSDWLNLCEITSSGTSGSGGNNTTESTQFSWQTGISFNSVTPPNPLGNTNNTTVGLADDGFVYAWGEDTNGVIQGFDPAALETDRAPLASDRFLPTPWKLSDTRYDNDVKKALTRNGMYIILTNSGDLYTFGNNIHNFVLSTGLNFHFIKPRLRTAPDPTMPIDDVYVTESRVVVLTDGKAYFWGDNLLATLSPGWNQIPVPSAAPGITYTEIMAVNDTDNSNLFLKGSDNNIYVAGTPSIDLLGSNGTTGTQSLTNASQIYKLEFPAGAGNIQKIRVSGNTAVAFDDSDNAYGWGTYAEVSVRNSTSESNVIHKNFVIDASATPTYEADSFFLKIVDPVLLAVPTGESKIVSFSKDIKKNAHGAFYVCDSGATYFIGDNTDSSISSSNLFTEVSTSLDYVKSISAEGVIAEEVYHNEGYVGLLDNAGFWYYFGVNSTVYVGGFQTPSSAAALNTNAVSGSSIALPLQDGSLDARNIRN